MKPFQAEQSAKTPFINMDPETGVFEIKGKSIPENSVEYYRTFFEWLDEYIKAPKSKTVFNIQLDYFNTSSAKVFADIFKKLESYHNSKKTEIEINWKHHEEDDDMQEAGDDYKSITNVPFNLISFE